MKLAIATITVKPDDWAAIRKVAERHGLNRAAYLRVLVSEALKADAKAAREEARL
jgi:hypothetical protein